MTTRDHYQDPIHRAAAELLEALDRESAVEITSARQELRVLLRRAETSANDDGEVSR